MREENRPYADILDPFTGDPMRVFSCGPRDVAAYGLAFLDVHRHDGWPARIVSPQGRLDVPADQVRSVVGSMSGKIAYIAVNRDAGRYFIGVSS